MQRILIVLVLALLAAACPSSEAGQRKPGSPDEGLQLTGQFDGRQLSVSHGDPVVLLGDCDAGDGLDEDFCLVARSIDGAQVSLVLENPAVFVLGEIVDVTLGRCTDCDDVADGAVVELRLDGEATRASSGRITVLEVGTRWSAEFTLRFSGGGVLTGAFSVPVAA